MRQILLCIFACFSLVSYAEEVTDLYRALVPVPDQTSEATESGINDAFSKVLIKLTGNSSIMQWPQLQPFLTDPRAFLDSVGFGELPNPTQGINIATGLEVSFDRRAIDKLIRQAQLPVLPSNRPKLLVWIIADDIPSGRRFINESVTQQNLADDYSAQLLGAFDDAMRARGMPYFFPSYDLEDQLLLSVNEAWSLRVDLLDRASQRYAADGWFAIRLYTASSGEIRGAWAYQHSGKRQLDDFRGDLLDAVIKTAVDDITDNLTQFYTYVPQLDTDQLLVQIDGISSFDSYQSLLEQFKKLEIVDSLQLFSVQGDELVLAVEVEGRVDRLHAELLRSGWLQSRISVDSRSIGRLTYSWVEK
ncbi:MAG: DUF2066 domain-containing protein [Porticoccaceae bacterium]|nr:DUF2066 domain-containing protein [Porticoccaceae bacterium]